MILHAAWHSLNHNFFKKIKDKSWFNYADYIFKVFVEQIIDKCEILFVFKTK